jgi:hypothetical protein
VAQFVGVNKLGVDPNTGMPAIMNQLGSLDVDIIIDEGPDSVNMMADSYDTLTALAGKGAQVPPQVLIELAPLQYSVKKRLLDMMQQAAQQPPPELAAKQAEMQLEAQKAQQDGQIKLSVAQQDAAIKQQAAEQQAQLKRDELAATIMLKRQEMEADIALERDKASAQMMLQGQKNAAQIDLARTQAEARAEREPATAE